MSTKWDQAEWFDKWFKERTKMDAQTRMGNEARAGFLAGELIYIRMPKPRRKQRKK